jgi:hypothetical protein
MFKSVTSQILALLFLTSLALAKEVTIHGFVTDIKSSSIFEIDDYRVARNNTLAINLDDERVLRLPARAGSHC